MRGEHQSGLSAHCLRQRCRCLAYRLGEHLDQQRVIEILAELDELRRLGSDRGPSPGDVLLVLGATGVATPGGGGEYRGAPNSVRTHCRDGVFDVGLPVAIAEVDRKRLPPLGQLEFNLLDYRTVDPVDRRDAIEVVVVLGYRVEALRRDTATPGDVLQERPNLLGPLGSAEREEKQRVDGTVIHQSSCVLAPPSA